MPNTYNDAWATYNDPSVLYNGIVLREHVTLIVAGADVTDELADEGLSVHTGSHGNSLGTLDAALDEPVVVPVVEDLVDYYVGLERLYRGTVKTVEADERHDGSLLATIGAQDAGPPGGVPDPAPFAVSDNPSPPATREYVSLSRQTRTTEGGAPKTTYRLVIEEDGLRPNMNVAVTSARFGLVAAELEIKEMVATRRFRDQPRYILTLGDPRVSLAQVVRDAEVPDGSITETKIGPGAISTPKLAALAVTADKIAAGSVVADKIAAGSILSDKFVAGSTGRIPAGVELGRAETNITADGLRVRASGIDRVIAGLIGTGPDVFGLKVVGPDGVTTIIDSSSNMHKIAAVVNHSVTVADDSFGETITTLTALGSLPKTPAHLPLIATGNTNGANQHIGILLLVQGDLFAAGASGGSPTTKFKSLRGDGEGHTNLNGSSQARSYITGRNLSGVSVTFYGRDFVFVEAAL